MLFYKVQVQFPNGDNGFAYYPLDSATNYRRVMILHTPNKFQSDSAEPKEGMVKRYSIFEFFQGMDSIVKVPCRIKKTIGANKKPVEVLEQAVKQTTYFSNPVFDPATVEQLAAWLDQNSINPISFGSQLSGMGLDGLVDVTNAFPGLPSEPSTGDPVTQLPGTTSGGIDNTLADTYAPQGDEVGATETFITDPSEESE